MLKMTSDISKQFKNGERQIALEPTIPRDMIMRAAQLENDGFNTIKASKKSGGDVEIFAAEKCPIENANVKYYQSVVK